MSRINEIRDRIAAGCVDSDIIFLVGEHARLTNEREEARDLAAQRGEQLCRMRERAEKAEAALDALVPGIGLIDAMSEWVDTVRAHAAKVKP